MATRAKATASLPLEEGPIKQSSSGPPIEIVFNTEEVVDCCYIFETSWQGIPEKQFLAHAPFTAATRGAFHRGSIAGLGSFL